MLYNYRVILLSCMYLQIDVTVCHQLLVSSLADIPAAGAENWQKLAKFRLSSLCGRVKGLVSLLNERSWIDSTWNWMVETGL